MIWLDRIVSSKAERWSLPATFVLCALSPFSAGVGVMLAIQGWKSNNPIGVGIGVFQFLISLCLSILFRKIALLIHRNRRIARL
jgi:hypothetical protein